MVLTRSQAKSTPALGVASYPTSNPANPSRAPRPQKAKTISKSKLRDPNENNITTPQKTTALKNIKKENTPGSRSVFLHVGLNPTAAVIRKPRREEKEKEKGEDEEEEEEDEARNTPPPANSNHERVTYPDISSELEDIQRSRVKNTTARMSREANIPLQHDSRARLITSSLQNAPNSNVIGQPHPGPRPRPKHIEGEESHNIARRRGRGGIEKEGEVELLPISITGLRFPARTLSGPRPYPPGRSMGSGLGHSISSSGSSHSRMSSERGGEDGDEMSDRERNERFSDGDEYGSAYPLPVAPQRDGSIVGSVEHDITHMAGQEDQRSLTQGLSIRFLKTIQPPFLFLYGLFRLAVLKSIIYILIFWVVMLEIQTIWPHGCLTFPSIPYLDTENTLATFKLCLYPPPLKASESLSTLSILHRNLTSVTSKLSVFPLDEDLPNTLQAITVSVENVKQSLTTLSTAVLEDLKTVEPVGEEGKSRLRQLEMRVSDKSVMEELRKAVRGSEKSSEGARRGLWELKDGVWEDGGRVIAVLNGTIWRLADLIKDGKGERVPEPEQNIKNQIAKWFRRDRHPEIDFLTVQILSLPSANNFSTTAYLAKSTSNHLSMLGIHLHIIPILVERLKFEVIFSIPGFKRKSIDALYDFETKIEPFDKFRREISRRRSGLDEIEQTYRGAGASVAELQRQAGGGLLKIEGLDDRVGDGKLLGVFRGAVEELEGARRRWRKLDRKNQDLGEESKERQGD